MTPRRPRLRAVPAPVTAADGENRPDRTQGTPDPAQARTGPHSLPLETVGVDPGERTTGVVTRDGSDPLAVDLIENPPNSGRDPRIMVVPADYLAGVFAAIDAQVAASWARTGEPPMLAVEGLNAPGGHLGFISIRPLLSAACVLGAVLARYGHGSEAPRVAGLRVIPPGRHGSLPLAAYPPQLVGARERPAGLKIGGGKLRHARSAFDIAGAARHPAYTGVSYHHIATE